MSREGYNRVNSIVRWVTDHQHRKLFKQIIMTTKQVFYRNILFERNIPFKTSDGTILYTDVYRPDADGQYPALIIRVPYDKSVAQSYNSFIEGTLRNYMNLKAVGGEW
jgi:predicted acyl esterase